jgi:hypothetical protein
MAIRNLDTMIFGALKGKEENDNNLDFIVHVPEMLSSRQASRRINLRQYGS